MLQNDPAMIRQRCQKDTLALPDGTCVPRLGQGTWHMAESKANEKREIDALRLGIEYGMTLIDTAEMYAEGGAETIVGQAIRGVDRDGLFIVSKVYPYNAGRGRIFASCEASLKRIGVDRLDLYLLHWRGDVPLDETVECMQELVRQGRIARWGVSNFDYEDMLELYQTPGGAGCAVNQVLYHLGARGIEYDLIPLQRKKALPLMAYCPLAQGGRLRSGMLEKKSVQAISRKYGISPTQALLAFVLDEKLSIAIPKASSPAHVLENAEMAAFALDEEDRMRLGEDFAPPTIKVPLQMR